MQSSLGLYLFIFISVETNVIEEADRMEAYFAVHKSKSLSLYVNQLYVIVKLVT